MPSKDSLEPSVDEEKPYGELETIIGVKDMN